MIGKIFVGLLAVVLLIGGVSAAGTFVIDDGGTYTINGEAERIVSGTGDVVGIGVGGAGVSVVDYIRGDHNGDGVVLLDRPDVYATIALWRAHKYDVIADFDLDGDVDIKDVFAHIRVYRGIDAEEIIYKPGCSGAGQVLSPVIPQLPPDLTA